jgi:ABC-2 type transport system ATP-binding protein
MNQSNDRIKISKLCKSFAKHKVLRDVDWSISAGTVVGLLGTNGSGKTTLIQCLLGLLKADSGSVMIDGEDAWDLSASVKARIGYVDQRPRFYPWMNGSDLLKYVGAMYPRWNAALCA